MGNAARQDGIRDISIECVRMRKKQAHTETWEGPGDNPGTVVSSPRAQLDRYLPMMDTLMIVYIIGTVLSNPAQTSDNTSMKDDFI